MNEIIYWDKNEIMSEIRGMSRQEILDLFALMFSFWETGIQETNTENRKVKSVYDMIVSMDFRKTYVRY